AHARADPGSRVGLRLRPRLELARGLRGLPAAQTRGRRRTPADPYGARRRIRAARGGAPVTFRERLTAAAAGAVAIAVILVSGATFFVVRAQLRSSMDASLKGIASTARFTETNGGWYVTLKHTAFGGAVGVAQVLEPNGGIGGLTGGTIPATAEA